MNDTPPKTASTLNEASGPTDTITERLTADANSLPSCPDLLAERIMVAVKDDDTTLVHDEKRSVRLLWPITLTAAAVLAIALSVPFNAPTRDNTSTNSGTNAMVTSPPTNDKTTAPSSTQPIAVAQLASSIEAMIGNPYEKELQHLEHDMGAATRFLMQQFGQALPGREQNRAATPAEPQG